MSLPADGQSAILTYAVEPDFAALPADGSVFRELIHNRNKVSGEPTVRGRGDISADHVNSDQMVITGQLGRGTYYGEARMGQLDDMLASLVSGRWSSTCEMEVVGTVAISAPNVVSLVGNPRGFKVGDIARLTGFTTPTNNAYARVVAIDSLGPMIALTVDTEPDFLVPEPATAKTRLHLANDVFALNVTDFVVSGNTITKAGAFALSGLDKGTLVFLSSPSHYGFYPLVSTTFDTLTFSIPVNGIVAGEPVTLKSSRLTNPLSVLDRVESSLRFEVTWPDVGTNIADTGVKVNTLRLKGTPGYPVTFELVTQSAGIVVDGAVLVEPRFSERAAQSGTAMHANNSNATFALRDTPVMAVAKQVALSFDAAWKPVRALGEMAPIAFNAGPLTLAGKITLLLDGSTLLTAFGVGEHAIFSWALQDDEGRGYVLTVPDCTIKSMPVTQRSPEGDVTMTLEFVASTSPGAPRLFTLDRFSTIL